MTVAARPALRSPAQARRLVGSPLPTDPVRAGSFASNMGLPPACRKHAKIRPMRPSRRRFPARRSWPTLINPDRFDKNFRRACLERLDPELGRSPRRRAQGASGFLRSDLPAARLRGANRAVLRSTSRTLRQWQVGQHHDRCGPGYGARWRIHRTQTKSPAGQPGFRFQDVLES